MSGFHPQTAMSVAHAGSWKLHGGFRRKQMLPLMILNSGLCGESSRLRPVMASILRHFETNFPVI
jgi:hypothetical protein